MFLYWDSGLEDSRESLNKNSKSNHDEGGVENSPQNVNDFHENEKSMIGLGKQGVFKVFNHWFSME